MSYFDDQERARLLAEAKRAQFERDLEDLRQQELAEYEARIQLLKDQIRDGEEQYREIEAETRKHFSELERVHAEEVAIKRAQNQDTRERNRKHFRDKEKQQTETQKLLAQLKADEKYANEQYFRTKERQDKEANIIREALLRDEKDKRKADKKHQEEVKNNRIRIAKNMGLVASAIFGLAVALGREGVALGKELGLSAVGGTSLNLRNKGATLSQLGTVNPNAMVTSQQLEALQRSFASVFVGIGEGMQFASRSSREFGNQLKSGFKSEFELTADSMRALITTGISTEKEFDNFRKATGKASISSAQFSNLVNKNALGFLIFGNKYAGAAIQAERLGINLGSVLRAQQGMVTNMDATIDTVAQLNQLGASVDFGKLMTLSELGDPSQVLRYLKTAIPSSLLTSSTSLRALAGQLGIDPEVLLRAQKTESTADRIEAQLSEAKQSNTWLERLLVAVERYTSVTVGALQSLLVAMSFVAGGFVGKRAGAKGAAMMGARFGAAFGPVGAAVGTVAGAGLGWALGSLLTKAVTANDVVIPSGYGSKAILTSAGAIALNNNDTIVAGTNLGGSGGSSDTKRLVAKVDALVQALQNAQTVVEIDGRVQTVPRMSMAGLRVRQEG